MNTAFIVRSVITTILFLLVVSFSASADAGTWFLTGGEPKFWDDHDVAVGKIVGVKQADKKDEILVSFQVESSACKRLVENQTIELRCRPFWERLNRSPPAANAVDAFLERYRMSQRILFVIRVTEGKYRVNLPYSPLDGGPRYNFMPSPCESLYVACVREDPRIDETMQLCQAIALKDLSARIAALEEIQNNNPSRQLFIRLGRPWHEIATDPNFTADAATKARVQESLRKWTTRWKQIEKLPQDSKIPGY